MDCFAPNTLGASGLELLLRLYHLFMNCLGSLLNADSGSVGLGQDLSFCNSNEHSGNAIVTGPGNILLETRTYSSNLLECHWKHHQLDPVDFFSYLWSRQIINVQVLQACHLIVSVVAYTPSFAWNALFFPLPILANFHQRILRLDLRLNL